MRVSDRERSEKSVKKIRLNDITKTTKQIERASQVRRTGDCAVPIATLCLRRTARRPPPSPHSVRRSLQRQPRREPLRNTEAVQLAEPTNHTVLVAHFSALPVALLALKSMADLR